MLAMTKRTFSTFWHAVTFWNLQVIAMLLRGYLTSAQATELLDFSLPYTIRLASCSMSEMRELLQLAVSPTRPKAY